MNEFENAMAQQHGQMSHEEILRRFRNLFGRDMTQGERRDFFLDALRPELPQP
jgi:hypothetical protein